MKYLQPLQWLCFGFPAALVSCKFFESIMADPQTGEAAGDAVQVAVEGVQAGASVGDILTGVGAVLGPVLAGAALRALRNFQDKPSRAADEVSFLRKRVEALESGGDS